MLDDAASKPPGTVDDGYESPMHLWEQIKIVTHRINFLLFRSMVYVNKFSLHSTCSQYLTGYMSGEDWRFNLINPDATSAYKVCEFGNDYLTTLNINHCHFGRRDAGDALAFGLMKLGTKASKKAE